MATRIEAKSNRGGENALGTLTRQVTPPGLPLNKGRYGGVMKFFRQYSIGPYILDFYCLTMKLAVELDGGQHNQSENKEYDLARSEYLGSQSIDVIRFWDHEVLLNMQGVTPLHPPLP